MVEQAGETVVMQHNDSHNTLQCIVLITLVKLLKTYYQRGNYIYYSLKNMTLINFTEDNLNFGLVASLWTVHTSRYLGQPN